MRFLAALLAFTLLACTAVSSRVDAFTLINASRLEIGLSALEWDEELGEKAQQWAEHLGWLNHLAHSNLSKGVTLWKVLGENVGVGGSVEGVHQALYASPIHRDNILNPRFTSVGTGVAVRNDRVFVVQIFKG